MFKMLIVHVVTMLIAISCAVLDNPEWATYWAVLATQALVVGSLNIVMDFLKNRKEREMQND